MRLIVPPAGEPQKLGLLPGTFNPPTRAHLALAEAALRFVDEVLLVLPAMLPHKQWEGATPEQRIDMLRLVTCHRPHIGAAVAEGGLFIEIAQDARKLFPHADVHIICGRDAAERIVNWDYGESDSIERQLEQFRLLVAPRGGCFEAPAHVSHAVVTLPFDSYDEYASARIRERSKNWRDLVPPEIAGSVEYIYRLGYDEGEP